MRKQKNTNRQLFRCRHYEKQSSFNYLFPSSKTQSVYVYHYNLQACQAIFQRIYLLFKTHYLDVQDALYTLK